MSHEINLLQSQAIKYIQQFRRTLRQPDKTLAIFPPSIQNDAPRPAERLYLARIDPFQVFEDGYKDQGCTLADIYKRHIHIPYRKTPPQRLDILHIGTKWGFVDEGALGSDSRGVHVFISSSEIMGEGACIVAILYHRTNYS